MPDEMDIKLCEDTTKHAHLGNTGSCLCGTKKYPKKEEGLFIARCPGCNNPPEVVKAEPTVVESAEQEPEVYCATEGCFAFSNTVSLSRWHTRAPHEMDVMRIPSTEPIFVLRSQDALALVPAWTWVDLAERKHAPEEKIDSATARVNEMDAWQRLNGNKIPD